jgi:hypothetical protein
MSAGAQFERCIGAVLRAGRKAAFLASVLVPLATFPAIAQQFSSTVGNIEGDNVTVSAGASGTPVSPAAGATIAVPNGGVINVPAGQARLMLVSGGEVDVCGPAKLTVLQSGDSVTLALDFGSVRLQLAVSTDLRIFTPTLLATPLAINGTPRDITVRLDPDDSLGVHADSGALLLESQFSNEKIVVPQAGQFFFSQGRLVPVVRNDMRCECLLKEARTPPPPTPWPPLGLTSPPQTAAASKPETPKADADDELPPDVEYSILARPNDAHPVNPEPKTTPPPPPDSTPSYKIVMPPLTFSASSPAPPPLPAENMILLIRTAEVDPDYRFTGHVDPPPLDEAKHADEKSKSEHGNQPEIEGTKPGFWRRLKHFFLGHS